jgi:hypothetical protein
MARTFFLKYPVLIITLLSILNSNTIAQKKDEDDGDDKTVPEWRYVFQKKYELFRDYGYDWRLGTFFALNSDDGLVLGAGPILYHFGFRTFPYVYRMELLGGGAIPTGRVKFAYRGLWPSISEHGSVDLLAHASELEVRNFYGYGNDTQRDEAKEGDGFYRIPSVEYLIQPTLRYSLGGESLLALGVGFKDFKVREVTDRFINQSNVTTFGDHKTLAYLRLGVVVDTRDHPLAPHSGIYFSAEGRNNVALNDDSSPFQEAIGDLRFYLGGMLGTDIMLALRVSGQKIFGTFPFFESAFLGGTRSLRGVPAERFAGDAMAFGSAELRISVGRWMLLVPTEIGVFGVGDAGRVWVDNDSPGAVHTDLGGGVWVAPLSRDTILSFLVAGSTEGLFVVGGIGFGF